MSCAAAVCTHVAAGRPAARPAAPAPFAAGTAARRAGAAGRHPSLPQRQLAPPPQAASSSSSNGASPAEETASSAAAGPADVAAQLEVLRRACRTKQVPPDEVLAAIQAVEAAQKQQPGLVQGFPCALTGTWRLVFSSPSPIKQWQYIPVLENAVIDADAGTVSLDSVVGPLDNSFKGRCSFESDAATGSFKMHFGFSASEAKWFGRWETKSELTEKRKTYTFFLLTDDVAAANSSGGPKTLMYRVRE